MRWYQAVPDPLPERRVWVQWNGLIEAMPVRDNAYGLAMLVAMDKTRDKAFGWLEWDVAPSNEDLMAMEAEAAAYNWERTITAPIRLYPASLDPATADRPSRGVLTDFTLSMAVFPVELLYRHRETIRQLRYPNADAEYFRQVQTATPCMKARPIHLHWL